MKKKEMQQMKKNKVCLEYVECGECIFALNHE